MKRGYLNRIAAGMLCLLLSLAPALTGCSQQEEETSAPASSEPVTEERQISLEDVKAGTVLIPGKREESVLVKTDASGDPKKITSEVKLSDIREESAAGELYVRDVSDLSDIRNKEGDESWVKDGDALIWEYKGEDIRYEGTASGGCPFGVKVTYYLNGEQTEPEQLAGATGDLKIRFDYTNATEEAGGYIPAAAMTVVFLPEKNFSDVEIENGTLLSIADQNAALGMAFPGLSKQLDLESYEPVRDTEIPEYVEIRAAVRDFKLSFTATVFTTGLFSKLEDEDLNDLQQIPDDMKELSDASKELVDGTGELYDGADELIGHAKEYFDGVHSMKKGIAGLKDGAGELHKNAPALNKGAAALEKGLKELKNGLAKVDLSGLSKLSGLDLGSLAKDLTKVDLTAMADQLEPMIGKEQADQLRGLQTSLSGLAKAAGQLQELSKAAGKLTKSMNDLKKGVGKLYSGSGKLTKGIKAYTKGVASLNEGVDALYDGAVKLDDAGKKLHDAFEELLEGIGELKDGFSKFDEEGIRELDKYMGEELRKVLSGITKLRDDDAAYQGFSCRDLPEGTEGSVRFIIETAEIK